MKAVAVRAFHGTPELMDLPKPKLRAGEVLVRMSGAGMNPFDRKIVDGLLKGSMPHTFPLILGVDGAGIVEARGDGAHRFSPGDSIYGQFFHAPVGEGTYAEFAVVPEKIGVAQAPETVDALHAAAAPTAGMTALVCLDAVDLSKGQTLLIVGASGGVGSFATELASKRGIQVIATASADATEFVRSLGASETIDYRRGSIVQQVRAGHPHGVDGLIDTASDKAGFATNAELVRRGGVASTPTGAADVAALREHGVRGINIVLESSAAILERLTREIDEAGLRIPVGATISLAGAPQAFARLRSGGARGKTVIDITRD